MQRFFFQTENDGYDSDDDIVDEVSSDSWYSTLSTAAGWLNPFNITRDGIGTTFIASFIFLKNITTATAVSCFKIVSDVDRGYVTNFKFDCISSARESSAMNALINNPQLHVNVIPCSQYTNLGYKFTYDVGHGHFGSQYFTEDTALCTLEQTMMGDQLFSQGWNRNVEKFMDSIIKDGWGSKLDYKITLGLAIPCGLIVTTAALLTTLFFVRRSQWNKNRRINNKCRSLTEALAKNDAALMDELKEMAVASDVVLPKEIMFYILQQTKGYDDEAYKRKYLANAAHNPCPQDFAVTPANGIRAPFIRFCDTLARENYRTKSLNRHWKDVKRDMRDRVNAALVEVVVNDEDNPILNDNNKMM